MFITKIKLANLVTYLGIIFSVVAIFVLYRGNTSSVVPIIGRNLAFICLILSGVCDLFDGMFARRFKRTDMEKNIGIQMDSLADVLNFLIVPVVIYISMGMDRWYHFIVYSFYVLCGITRLAFFNVFAEEHKGQILTVYKGLAVTFASLIYPIAYVIFYYLVDSIDIRNVLNIVIMLVVSVLFVLDVPIPKPNRKGYIVLSILAIIMLFIFGVVL